MQHRFQAEMDKIEADVTRHVIYDVYTEVFCAMNRKNVETSSRDFGYLWKKTTTECVK